MGQDLFLDLGREDVDAAHNHHVIAAPGDLVHAPHGPGAARQQAGEIAGAVADDRHGLLGEAGEYQFPFLAIGQHLTGFRIDDFGVEVVLPDGRAVLGLQALLGHSGAHHLRQAIDVHRVDAQALFDFPAHGFGPGFRPENAQAQRQFMGVYPLAIHLIGDVEHVGRGHHDDVRVEIPDQLDLLFRAAAGHGNYRAAQLLRAVVGAQAAGEQAVAIGDMYHVFGAAPGGADGAGDHRRPGLDVVAGVAHHGGLAGGAAGGVDAHHLFPGGGEHAEGVVGAQVRLGGKGKQAQVSQGLQVIGMHALVVEGLAVMRHVVVGMAQAPAHTLQLQCLQGLFAGRLDCFQVHVLSLLWLAEQNSQKYYKKCCRSMNTRIIMPVEAKS